MTGTFTVDVPGQIAGAVNGNVFVNGRLIVLKNAVINGNVQANELEILGSVTGDIYCSGKMILQNHCSVKGNISTVEIHIEKDAVVDGIITKPGFNFDGEIEIEKLDEPLVEKEDDPVINEEPVLNNVEAEEVQSWF